MGALEADVLLATLESEVGIGVAFATLILCSFLLLFILTAVMVTSTLDDDEDVVLHDIDDHDNAVPQ